MFDTNNTVICYKKHILIISLNIIAGSLDNLTFHPLLVLILHILESKSKQGLANNSISL